MIKKMVAAALCAVLALALLPTMALAAGATVTIGGTSLPSGSYYVNGTGGAVGTISATEPSGWHAHYDGTTLYLNGLVLTNYAGKYGISIDGGHITLDLTGDSEVSVTGQLGSAGLSVYNGYDLTVQSTNNGSLTATSSAAQGAIGVVIYDGSFTINSGTLRGVAAGEDSMGIHVNGSITVSGSGELYGKSSDVNNNNNGGVYGYFHGITVLGGKLHGEGYRGIMAYGNRLTISGGEVTGIGSTAGALANDVTISGGVALFTGAPNSIASIDSQPFRLYRSAHRHGQPERQRHSDGNI